MFLIFIPGFILFFLSTFNFEGSSLNHPDVGLGASIFLGVADICTCGATYNLGMLPRWLQTSINVSNI